MRGTLGWRKYGATQFSYLDPRIETVPESGCWVWLKALDRKGYGITSFNGTAEKAYRATWITRNGEIPPSLVLDHVCRNRSCVNPDHLRAVTRRENALFNSNGASALNLKKTHCTICGDKYRVTQGGRRECRECVNEIYRRYRRNKKSRKVTNASS